MKFRHQDWLPLGVVVERRSSDHPWQDHVWRPVSVFAGAPARDPKGEWSLLREGEGWVQFHAGTLNLEAFRTDTEGYKVNLSQDPPRVFVVLRRGDETAPEHEVVPFHVTACPFEAQVYLDNGEDIVEPVAMPPEVAGWLKAYVDEHHVDAPFKKRKRKPHDPRKGGDGGGPVRVRGSTHG